MVLVERLACTTLALTDLTAHWQRTIEGRKHGTCHALGLYCAHGAPHPKYLLRHSCPCLACLSIVTWAASPRPQWNR